MAQPIYDVLIIGAGPTGLVAACELYRQGIRNFLIVDQLNEPVISSKGTFILPTTMETIRFYTGAEQTIKDWAAVAKNIVFHLPQSGNVFSMSLTTEKSLNYIGAYECEQWVTEKALTDYLTENGVVVQRGVKMINFDDQGELVRATLQVDQEERVIYCKYLIAADGARSQVRKTLGITYAGETSLCSSMAVHLGDLNECSFGREDFICSLGATGKNSLVIPMHEGSFVFLDLDEEDHLKYSLDEVDSHGFRKLKQLEKEEMQMLVKKRFGFKDYPMENIIWQTHFRVNNRLASGYWNKSRIFLLGDAAHSSTPAIGLGLNFGIADALNLTWKMGHVLNGIASPKLLESYEKERRDHASKQLFQVVKQNASNLAAPLGVSFKMLFLKFMLSFDYTKSLSVKQALGVFFDIPKASAHTYWGPSFALRTLWRRLLYFTVKDYAAAGSRLNPYLLESNFIARSNCFKAIVFQSPRSFADQASEAEMSVFSEQLELSPAITEVVVVEKSKHQDIFNGFGVIGQCIFIIRPDGFIGLRSHVISPEVVRSFLKDNMKLIQ